MVIITAEIQMVMKRGPGATLLVISDGIIVISVSARNGQNFYFNDLHALIFFNCNENRPWKVQRSMCRRQWGNIQWSYIKDCIRLYLSTMGFKTSTCTKSLTRPGRKEFIFCLTNIFDDIFLPNSIKTIIIVEILTVMMMALGATPPIQK